MAKKFIVFLTWVYLSSFGSGWARSHILKSDEEEHGNSTYTFEEEHEEGYSTNTFATERIIGGRPTNEKKYPFMVLLQEKEDTGFEGFCGGAVLNENWILTAAHCIDYPTKPHKYRVLAGLHRLSKSTAWTVQKIKISEMFLHKGYVNVTLGNDIALLKTANPINIAGSNSYVDSIHLPKTNKDPTGYAKVIGWGHTNQDGENSDILRESNVPIIPRDLCNKAYDDDLVDGSDEITETMICAGKAERDSCQNDSGGPLFQTSSDGKPTLIGIVSFGVGCGERDFPGVYTKVYSYKNWIENIMSK